MAATSNYVRELETTAGLVAAKFGITKWKLAYTSRSGAPTDPWLEPDVCDEIRDQAMNGVREILAIPHRVRLPIMLKCSTIWISKLKTPPSKLAWLSIAPRPWATIRFSFK